MITRADAEKILIRRAGRKMAVAGMDGTTNTGANLDLNDPMATALLGMGITPASIALVTDADLAGADAAELLDRAELRLLENIAGNIDLVDITVGPRRESLSQLTAQVEKAIERLTQKIAALYGSGTGSLEAGVIALDFVEGL